MYISDQRYLAWNSRLKTNKFFGFFWNFGSVYIVGFFYLGIIFLFIPQLRLMTILAFLAFVFSRFVVCEIIYFVYKKQRPYQRLGFLPPESKIFISWANTRNDSLPSGHAASLVAISTVCLFYFPALGILGLIASAFNSVSRVVVGYHHPSDILAGWVVGAFSGLVAFYLFSPMLFTR